MDQFEFVTIPEDVDPLGHFVSLGAGVQSSAMLLMALDGEIGPRPLGAIFADTGWEPPEVYDWLGWLRGRCEAAGVPLHIVSRPGISLRDTHLSILDRYAEIGGPATSGTMPLWMATRDGERKGPLTRQCTRQYKVAPVQAKLRKLGATKARPAIVWMGISLDEIQRMKPARVKSVIHRWPLIERRLTRADCLAWMKRQQFPEPPRSACIGCPYRSNHEWRRIKDDPALWAEAVEMDRAVREWPTSPNLAFLHQDAIPLEEVDLSRPEDRGQISLFGNECEGMCGV